MELNLYIYSGLGNIIALVDLLREDLSLSPEEVVKIAELEGVEFDQLISILPPKNPDVDLSAEIYNADGSIAIDPSALYISADKSTSGFFGGRMLIS